MPLSWKIGAAVAGLLVASLAWHGIAQYIAQRNADEIMKNLAQTDARNAQLAQQQAQEYSAKVAATLSRQQQDLYLTNQQVNEQARLYQAQQAERRRKEHEALVRQQERFKLGPNQKCVLGQVVNARGSIFTQVTGKNGKPIPCTGQIATEPLR